MTRFRLSLSGSLCALVFLVPAAMAQEYKVTEIPFLPGGNSIVTAGINQSGEVTGSANNPDIFSPVVFLYSNGITQNMEFLPGFYVNTGQGINDAGDIAGFSVWYPWAQATLTSAGVPYSNSIGSLPGGRNSYGLSINNSDQITGMADAPSGYLHAFLYSNGAMQDLGVLPDGHHSKGWSINNLGEVAGVGDSGKGLRGFIYKDGKMSDIGVLPGGTESGATAINDCGQVTGSSDSERSGARAILYSSGRMMDLGVLRGATRSYGNAINNFGEVVGGADDGDTFQHAFLYVDGKMQDLNDLIPRNSGWILQNATGINDAGEIAVTGTDTSGDQVSHGFLLTPVHPGRHKGNPGCHAASQPESRP